MFYIVLLCLFISFILQCVIQINKSKKKDNVQFLIYLSYIFIAIAIIIVLFC